MPVDNIMLTQPSYFTLSNISQSAIFGTALKVVGIAIVLFGLILNSTNLMWIGCSITVSSFFIYFFTCSIDLPNYAWIQSILNLIHPFSNHTLASSPLHHGRSLSNSNDSAMQSSPSFPPL